MENSKEKLSEKLTVYELCRGGSCCPIIVKDKDGNIYIKENDYEIPLTREHLESLKKFIEEELLKDQ
jgi:hypothetical protein